MSDVVLRVDSVSKSYFKGKKVLDEISITLNKGDTYAYVGGNGSGKTTTLRIITGLLSADVGDVFINGHSVTQNPYEAKKQFNFIPDNISIYPRVSGFDWISFVCSLYEVSPGDRDAAISKYAERFDMETSLEDAVGSYSLGMLNKLSLITALTVRPPVIIMDEPMHGLDPIALLQFEDMLRDYTANGGSVLLSTHLLDIAEKICNKVGIIRNSKILLEDDISNIKKGESLESLIIRMIK